MSAFSPLSSTALQMSFTRSSSTGSTFSAWWGFPSARGGGAIPRIFRRAAASPLSAAWRRCFCEGQEERIRGASISGGS